MASTEVSASAEENHMIICYFGRKYINNKKICDQEICDQKFCDQEFCGCKLLSRKTLGHKILGRKILGRKQTTPIADHKRKKGSVWPKHSLKLIHCSTFLVLHDRVRSRPIGFCCSKAASSEFSRTNQTSHDRRQAIRR